MWNWETVEYKKGPNYEHLQRSNVMSNQEKVINSVSSDSADINLLPSTHLNRSWLQPSNLLNARKKEEENKNSKPIRKHGVRFFPPFSVLFLGSLFRNEKKQCFFKRVKTTKKCVYHDINFCIFYILRNKRWSISCCFRGSRLGGESFQ